MAPVPAVRVAAAPALKRRVFKSAPPRRSIASSLVLPAFSPDVPRALRTGMGNQTVANICEVLLDAGLFVSGDWKGNLVDSFAAGLGRIVAQSGVNSMEILTLKAFCMTNARGELHNVLENCVGQEFGLESKCPGAFGLTHDPFAPLPVACVGARINDLEMQCKGAGFAVLSTLSRVLETSINAMTPAWAYSIAREWFENQIYDDADWDKTEHKTLDDAYLADTGELTPRAFLQTLPRAAVQTRPSVTKLNRGILSYYDRDSPDRALLVQSLELEHLWRKTLRRVTKGDLKTETHVGWQGEEVVPLVIHWNENDAVTHISDNYLNHLSEWAGDDVTEVVWSASFDVAQPQSVVIAVKRFQLCLKMLAMADDILSQLHTDRPAPLKIRYPVPLLQSLAIETEVEIEPQRVRIRL